MLKRGRRNFNHPIATGNGRSCATCHVKEDHFQLTPAHVERRYQKLLAAKAAGDTEYDDPLFRSIDANDFADDYTNLRKGLVRVTLPLPPNITVAERPGATSISVWRSVPSIENAAFTAPYQLDGRAATLPIQALGAAIAHSQVTTAPDSAFLSSVSAFQSNVFSSERLRSLNVQIQAGLNPPRSDVALNAQQSRGRNAFEFFCAGCHGGGSMTQNIPARRPQMSISVSELNKANLPVWTFKVKQPDGTIAVRKSPDLGRALIDGKLFLPSPDGSVLVSIASAFEIPSLYGVKDTAPYFHDNSAADLRDVMNQYVFRFKFAREVLHIPDAPPDMTPEEIEDILAYVETL
ncbi:MAG: hypothetical protein NVS4B10_25080 [Myxococcales bacterium]